MLAQDSRVGSDEPRGGGTGAGRGSYLDIVLAFLADAAGVVMATLPCRTSPALNCAWRDMSIDSPRMRAISCGAWKPMEFSAATQSRRHCAARCSSHSSLMAGSLDRKSTRL